MSRFIDPRRRPSGAVRVNPAAGLHRLYTTSPATGGVRGLGQGATSVGGTPLWGGGVEGQSLWVPSDANALTLGTTNDVCALPDVTILVVGESTKTSGQGNIAYCERSGIGNAIWKVGRADGAGSNTMWQFVHRNDAGSLTRLNGGAAINDGRVHWLSVVKRGQSVKMYRDGVQVVAGALNGNDALTVTDRSIGRDGTTSGDFWGGHLYTIAIWARALPEAQIASMTWGDLYWQPSGRVYVTLTAGGGGLQPAWARQSNVILGMMP